MVTIFLGELIRSLGKFVSFMQPAYRRQVRGARSLAPRLRQGYGGQVAAR